jgi:predicted DNA-binding ribbon-helix-helix protein
MKAEIANSRGRAMKATWKSAHITDQTPVCKNINVSGRRTSVRMEPVMWRSLNDIRDREGLTLNQICTLVDSLRGEMGLTAALRVFIISYYRAVAVEMAKPEPAADGGRSFRFGVRSKPLNSALEVFG